MTYMEDADSTQDLVRNVRWPSLPLEIWCEALWFRQASTEFHNGHSSCRARRSIGLQRYWAVSGMGGQVDLSMPCSKCVMCRLEA